MQLFVLVLNRTEYMEKIFEVMLEKDIRGATILDSTGMMRALSDDENVDLPMLGILRYMYDPERKKSKTIFIVMKDEQVQTMMDIIRQVTGGLDSPDSGIAFALPLTFVEGLVKKK